MRLNSSRLISLLSMQRDWCCGTGEEMTYWSTNQACVIYLAVLLGYFRTGQSYAFLTPIKQTHTHTTMVLGYSSLFPVGGKSVSTRPGMYSFFHSFPVYVCVQLQRILDRSIYLRIYLFSFLSPMSMNTDRFKDSNASRFPHVWLMHAGMQLYCGSLLCSCKNLLLAHYDM